MIKRLSLISLLILSFLNLNAQDVYWPSGSAEINTGTNSTYLIQATSFDGETVVFGYTLGAFYLDDNNDLTCGGLTFWSGSQTDIAVFADDSTTPEKDGFSEGEQITWLAYGTFASETYNASVSLLMGSENYSSNSINIVSEFSIDATVEVITGCTDIISCNYNIEAEEDDGSCTYAEAGYNCDGTCIDLNNNSLCDIDETSGCTDNDACNYVTGATDDDGSCTYAEIGYDCDGNCLDADNDTVCDFDEIAGCTDPLYLEYNELATDNDGSCKTIAIVGCTDSNAFNYAPTANSDSGNCITDINVLFESVAANSTANYNVQEDQISVLLGSSEITTGDLIGGFYISDGQLYCGGYAVWSGTESLSIALWADVPYTEEIEGFIEGQTIYWIAQQTATQQNYLLEITYTLSDGTFEIGTLDFFAGINTSTTTVIGCLDNTAFNYNENAFINDGSCVPFIYGCIDETLCNYNEQANTDDGSCYTFEVNLTGLEYNSPMIASSDLTDPVFNWFLNGEALSISGSEFTPEINGEYMVSVTDDLGCTLSESIIVENVSIEDLRSLHISIYPIPATNYITIDAGTETINRLKLYSIEGKVIMNLKPDTKSYSLNCKNLAHGLYYITLDIEDSLTKKLIVIE